MAWLALRGGDGALRGLGAPLEAGHLAPVGAMVVPHVRAGERRAFVAATVVSLAFVAVTNNLTLQFLQVICIQVYHSTQKNCSEGYIQFQNK